jgi:TonB family protein
MRQKIKIMKQKPVLSDEEIRSYMDFDRLMADSKLGVSEPVRINWMKRVLPVIVITGIVVWVVLYKNTNTKPAPPVVMTEHNENPVKSPEVEAPIVHQEESIQENNSEKVPAEPQNEPAKTNGNLPTSSTPKKSEPVEDVYVQAEPVEGYESLYNYFNSQLVYPAESVKDSIQGVQTISFIINAQGRPENIQVKQSLGEPFEKEAKRLIEKMPVWKPATLNGKPVASQMSLPLTFQIKKVNVK